jgi:V8-like Glu-specific endopeptidase
MTPKQFLEKLKEKLACYDKLGAAELCQQLISFLYQSNEPFPNKMTKEFLVLLRNYRMFNSLQQVTDALIFTGRSSFTVNRQYAQALIESGAYSAALIVLEKLVDESKKAVDLEKDAKSEFEEAIGLMGRLYKQLYVNTAKQNVYNSALLKKSVQAYYAVYGKDRSAWWHGINVVAMLRRADADGIELDGYPDFSTIANEIYKGIMDKEEKQGPNKSSDPWDYAIAAEACAALEMPEEAEKWTAFYAAHTDVNAFSLSGTIRQFEEVWNMGVHTEMGMRILSVLRAELIRREGGNLVVQAAEIPALKEQNLPDMLKFEKNFGVNVFINFKAYKKGYACCEAVARIGRNELKGEGTGFLLDGGVLHNAWKNMPVLITNAHVISEASEIRRKHNALSPKEAIIFFEALDRNQHFHIDSILWTSPPDALDITIVNFLKDEVDKLRLLTKEVTPYQLAPVLPIPNGDPLTDPRLFVIGHPKGGPLQFSVQDNLLLDCEDPVIHYRTPTEGGSSGSPVFTQEWQLLGVHHKGDKEMKQLNGKTSVYEANEGMYIQTIIERLNKEVV